MSWGLDPGHLGDRGAEFPWVHFFQLTSLGSRLHYGNRGLLLWTRCLIFRQFGCATLTSVCALGDHLLKGFLLFIFLICGLLVGSPRASERAARRRPSFWGWHSGRAVHLRFLDDGHAARCGWRWARVLFSVSGVAVRLFGDEHGRFCCRRGRRRCLLGRWATIVHG